ncbi:MAG TPA: hypothetical protein VEA59_00860 [Patescibacteria group bacterium]|nr:hypothetical protein [Patescibacteria group bacterium]
MINRKLPRTEEELKEYIEQLVQAGKIAKDSDIQADKDRSKRLNTGYSDDDPVDRDTRERWHERGWRR